MSQMAVIFGSKGMLARALAAELKSRGIAFVGLDLPNCDLCRPADVAASFQLYQPNLVFNCAAFTRVDACEDQQPLANAVNGHAVMTLAEMAKAFGAKLIHVSTDFVFEGNSDRPYRPEDEPGPISAYGRSKLLGERLLAQVNPPGWATLRTAWLFGVGGPNFPRTMVEVGRQGKPLRVVSDQVGCPTYTEDLASAMIDVALRDAQGIFHCTNSGQTNWYELACEALRVFGVSADIAPITTDEYLAMRPKQAKRPAYSVLDCSSLETAIGRKMRPWQETLPDFRDKVQANGGF